MKPVVLFGVAILMLTGCASAPEKIAQQTAPETLPWYPSYQSALQTGSQPDFDTVTTLTDEQKAAFRSWYNASSNKGLTLAQRRATSGGVP